MNIPSIELVDTHCHLQEEAFSGDLLEVLDRAQEAGVTRMIVVGFDLASSRRAVALSASYPGRIFAAVGIQPNYIQEAHPGDYEEIERLLAREEVVALGEIGLDRYWNYAPIELQYETFQRQITMADQAGLPFVVHSRDAEQETLQALREARERLERPLRGVMHSFSYSVETALACIELGMHISFSGPVTYKNAFALREVAKTIPLERIVVETDAPYLTPSPHRGKRNEPAYVRFAAAAIAEARGIEQPEFARASSQNASDLFFGGRGS